MVIKPQFLNHLAPMLNCMSLNSVKQKVTGINRKSLSFLLAGLALGAILVFLGANYSSINSDQASKDLVSALEQSTGQNLEIVSSTEENGLYKIQIKNQNDQLSTYYITKNGELVAQDSSFTDFGQFKNTIEAQAQFSNCMSERDVVMFGNQSQRATAAQIQLLGGPNQVSDIYADVNNEQVLQQAVQLGVSSTPAFLYQNSTAQGVQTIPQLEDFTGCTYQANATGN
jgi:hypothetical protein